MAELLKARSVVADDWLVFALPEGETPQSVTLPAGKVLVPLAVWQARKAELLPRTAADATDRVGVWLAPQEDPAELAGDLASLGVIGVHFPVPGDGRGYSIAALLRSRQGFRGELHALGAIERDYLHYLRRVGFDVFHVGNPASAVASLVVFSEAYQASNDQPLPLFRRSPAAVAT